MERKAEIDALVVKYGQQYPNCAQISFLSTCEALGLQCDQKSFTRALTAFPGIGHRGETCGAVSGPILAMGLALAPEDHTDADQTEKCDLAVVQFCAAVTAEIGSTACGDITEKISGKRVNMLNPAEAKAYAEGGGAQGCLDVIRTAVNIAAALVDDARKSRATSAA